MKFLNLFLGAAAVGSVLTAPTSDTAILPKADKRASKFKFVGVNQSGAEFGNKVLPGKLGKEYTWPVRSSIDVRLSSFHISPPRKTLMRKQTLIGKGMNTFRVAFMM